MHVTVRGDGIAARCCARLLERGDFCVALQRRPRPKPPAIMIGATTQGLFRDAFEQNDLFGNLHTITRRVVAWGPDGKERVLPHSAVVAHEQSLLERLQPPVANPEPGTSDGWTIVTSRPLPESCVEQHFGTRIARALPVRLNEDADPSACWVESLENGWLFLLPDGPATGWLLAAGDAGESLVEGSRLVRRQIAGTAGEPAEFPAYPRISWPLCGPGWLACGTGALTFDPLCGDGSGHAIREAILATAVLRAIERGSDADELLAHYRTRLLAGFRRHLDACEEFYCTGGSTPWWQAQLAAVRYGSAWCARELQGGIPARYQLRGFDIWRIGDLRNTAT